jgi:sugar/nucleoside kinase (ribokinase family)
MIVAAVGDCGIDRYVNLRTDRPGGIALNFAVNARRLFAPDDRILVITALGTDPEGVVVAEVFRRFGLESAAVWLPGRTPVQSIERLASGERRFVGYEEGVLGDYHLGRRERAIVADTDLLMTTAFRQGERLFESAMASPSRGLRAVDFSDLADFGSSADFVSQWTPFFHVAFFGLTDGDDALIGDLFQLAVERDRLFVVTLGARGSVALSRAGRMAAPAVPVVSVVDTTGAGDTFAAAFLAEYCRSRDVAAALALGNREAAGSIQRLGAF